MVARQKHDHPAPGSISKEGSMNVYELVTSFWQSGMNGRQNNWRRIFVKAQTLDSAMKKAKLEKGERVEESKIICVLDFA
jgi:hypothetical protein